MEFKCVALKPRLGIDLVEVRSLEPPQKGVHLETPFVEIKLSGFERVLTFNGVIEAYL